MSPAFLGKLEKVADDQFEKLSNMVLGADNCATGMSVGRCMAPGEATCDGEILDHDKCASRKCCEFYDPTTARQAFTCQINREKLELGRCVEESLCKPHQGIDPVIVSENSGCDERGKICCVFSIKDMFEALDDHLSNESVPPSLELAVNSVLLQNQQLKITKEVDSDLNNKQDQQKQQRDEQKRVIAQIRTRHSASRDAIMSAIVKQSHTAAISTKLSSKVKGCDRTKCADGALPRAIESRIPSVNGCGPEDKPLVRFYLNKKYPYFIPACCEHDRCYGDLTKSKENCDFTFLNMMMRACDETSFWVAPLCGLEASLMFSSVYVGGCSSFNAAQHEVGCPDNQNAWTAVPHDNICFPFSGRA
jgi:hypothetical protein